MSRARNIKPAFFKNDVLAELPFEYRILFQGLWCEADREGRLEDRPRRIKAEVFPYDDVDVDAGLNALQSKGFIVRYTHGETQYIQVLAFAKHQNPHCKEAASTIPAPDEHSACTVQASEVPERAGLIPDSLNLIPDPPTPKGDGSAEAVVEAYNRILPGCQSVSVLNDKRKKRIAAAVKLARTVCRQQGWEYVPADFWSAYFSECALDPWMRGEVPNPKNPNWKQNLDVLLAEDRFAGVMDRAIASMRASA